MKIDGGKGGRAVLNFSCARIGKPCSFTLLVNGKNCGGVNVMPGTIFAPSVAQFTVPLKSGKTNQIALEYLDGQFEILSLETEFLDE